MRQKVMTLLFLGFVLAASAFIVKGVVQSASDSISPEFVNVGQVVNFTIYNWDEAANQSVYICKRSDCYSCDNTVCIPTGSYCYGRNNTYGPSPRRIKYTVISTDTGGAWYYRLRNASGSMSECMTGSIELEVNHAPSTILAISPSSPTPIDDIKCTGTFTDSDGDDVSAICKWGGCSGGCPSCTAPCGSANCEATLADTSFSLDDQIYCNMTVTDEHAFAGSKVTSSVVTVQYSSSLSISPSTATVQKDATQRFDAANGGSPFRWRIQTGGAYCTLSSSTVSYVTLTGVAVGNCTVNVTDYYNRSALTGIISIIDTNAPAAPTNLQAADVAGDLGGSISVTWALSIDDGQNENDVVRYKILRSITSASGYANIANVSAGTSSYTDNNVDDGTIYYYKLRACDSSGLCSETATYGYAIANAQPRMSSVTIRPQTLRATTDVECIGVAYDLDETQLNMSYAFTILAFPPGGTSRTVSGLANCIYFGPNTTDQYGAYHQNATTECRAALSHSYLTKADKVTCSMTATDGMETVSMTITEPYIPVNNTAPNATNVRIIPINPNASSILTCDYTYNDIDGDPEDTNATIFKWYINNEGLNSWIQIPNQVGSTLAGYFDRDDYVKCAVRVKDKDESWMHDSDYASGYTESNQVRITDNALPQIIAYSDNSNATNPTNVGSQILFNATWIDYEDPNDMAKLFVCDDYEVEENQYSNGNLSVWFGDNERNQPISAYFYTNKTGQYVHTIAVKPYKYVQNNMRTYASDTIVENGDAFVGTVLRNFTREAFYDEDRSGTYTYGETIIRENTGGTKLRYDTGRDNVIVGIAPPDGAILYNLTKYGYRYADRDVSNNFTSDDDIYSDRDSSYSVSGADIRRTVVSENNVRSASTDFIYDMYVYEVNNVGENESSPGSLLIAQDHNEAFILGVYNYIVPEFNAQPLAGKHLAFKFCIDSDDDGVCDSAANLMNDSVYLHASSTPGNYQIKTPEGTFYNPDIQINYREADNAGCANIAYCNTSFSSSHTQSCSYTAKESDSTLTRYVLKVCDNNRGCSVQREGTFYVNHLPTIGKVNISSSKTYFSDDANLNCTVYGATDLDGNNLTFSYHWLLKRGTNYTRYDVPNNRILTNGNTLPGDEWKCEATPYDSYSKGYNKNSTAIVITNASFAAQRIYIVNVTDNSNKSYPTNVGDKVTFRVSFGGTSQVRAFICNSSSILDNGCWDTTFNSSGLTSNNPIIGTYRVQEKDFEKSYWVRICTAQGNCSNNFPAAGAINFSVNHLPRIGIVNISSSNGNYTETSNLNCTVYGTTDADSDSVTYSYKWYQTYNYENPSTANWTQIGSNTVNGPILANIYVYSGYYYKCEAIPNDGHSLGAGLNSSPVRISSFTTPTPPLKIINVTDNSNRQNRTVIGQPVTFTVTWTGGSPVKILICNSSTIYESGCADGVFQIKHTIYNSPTIIYHYPSARDFEENYWVRVCNYTGGCSAVFPQTGVINFSVNHYPTVGIVNISSTAINYTDSANLNCSAYGGVDLDSDNITYTYKWLLKRNTRFERYYVPSNNILTNGNTLIGDEWKCEATPKDRYGAGTAVNSTAIKITNSTHGTSGIRIISVKTNSNRTHPTDVGSKVIFNVTVYNPNNHLIKMYVCNTSQILDNGCWDRTFNSTVFFFDNKLSGSYTARADDNEENYWIKVCEYGSDYHYNCTNNYPESGTVNFSVNHRPNASKINVSIVKTSASTLLKCEYTYSDPDQDNRSNTYYRWYVNESSGYALSDVTTGNISASFREGTRIKCSVLVRDQHGFQDSQYKESSNEITMSKGPKTPTIWPLPWAIRTNTVNIIGYMNSTGNNVSAAARQEALTPYISSVVTNWKSTLIGTARTARYTSSGKRYIMIRQNESDLFTTSRYIQFINHNKTNFIRYSITGKQDMFDGTYRIDLGENLSANISYNTFMKVYNSSKPTGWFNISLQLYNKTNWILVKAITDLSESQSASATVYVDKFPPRLITKAIPDVTNSNNITFKFNISDDDTDSLDAILSTQYLMVKIVNKTRVIGFKPVNYSVPLSVYANSAPNISCIIANITTMACSLFVRLNNGTYNFTMTLNDTAGYNVTFSKQLIVDRGAIIITRVSDGWIDGDIVHIPSDFASTTNLTANWTSMTGVDYYEYRLDQYNASVFDKTIVQWTNVGNQQKVNITANISNGYVYYVLVRAKMASGGYSAYTSSDGIIYLDSTAPTCLNCVHNTGDFTNSNDTLHFYWNFTERESAIIQYQYTIGTRCYPFSGYSNLVGSNITYVNRVTKQRLKLADGQSYCLSVKAKNTNGIWSQWKWANITVDKSKPFNGSINYTSGYIQGNSIEVRFSQGKDNISGIRKVQLQMASLPLVDNDCGGIYNYNLFSNFSTEVLGQTRKSVPVQSGRCYKFQYIVSDMAGNTQAYPRGTSIVAMVDNTDPQPFTVTLNNREFYTQSNTLQASWTAATDLESGIAYYMYALFENATQRTGYKNTTGRTVVFSAPLTHMGSYYLKVRAYNRAGGYTDSNSNTILFLDFTPPAPVTINDVDGDSNATNRYMDLNGNNITNINVTGEEGMSCLASPYDIDYTENNAAYITRCNLTNGGPKISCSVHLHDGNYTYYISCRDLSGNAQDASQNTRVDFIVDGYGPQIIIVKPKANETVGARITIDADITDNMGVSRASYRVVGLNGTQKTSGALNAPNYNTSWNTVGTNISGLHFLIVRANDTLGHRSNKTSNFTIDNGRPVIDIIHARFTNTNLALTIRAQLFVNVSFNITNKAGAFFLYRMNSSVSSRLYTTWVTLINVSNVSRWSEGNYTITVKSVNMASNRTVKGSKFTLDRTPPKYSNVLNTAARTYYRNSTVLLNVTWIDNHRLGTVWFSHNGTTNGNWTNVSASMTGSVASYSIIGATLTNHQSVGWYSYAYDAANNSNKSMAKRSFVMSNRKPNITSASNVTVNATRIARIIISATDPDNDNLSYYVNDSRFNKTVTNIFEWNTTINDSGTYVVNVTVSDNRDNVSRKVWVFVLGVYDTDGDGIPDFDDPDSDGDGNLNTVDFLNGGPWNVNTTIPHFNCTINNSYNWNRVWAGNQVINCSNGSMPIMTFSYNFSKRVTLNMIRITVQRQANTSGNGGLLVRGLRLLNNTKKTVFVQHINMSANALCVKDSANARSISEISPTCNAVDEKLVICDGATYSSNYTCINRTTYFETSGLGHSAAREVKGTITVQENNNPPSSGGGGGGGGVRFVPKKYYQCNDGIDNDRDGFIDMADLGCKNNTDNDEYNLYPKACIESWTCTSWSECSEEGQKTRGCKDSNSCGTKLTKPDETSPCTNVPTTVKQSCYDGIHNQGESGLDCGGPCNACSTCVDGIQNQGESGVDCGGPCPGCSEDTGSMLSSPIIPLIALIAVLITAAIVLYSEYINMTKGPEAPSAADEVRRARLIELEKLLVHRLNEGLSAEKLKEEAAQKGWPATIVERVVEVREFVKAGINTRHTSQRIRHVLEKHGWSHTVIDEVFKGFTRKL